MSESSRAIGHEPRFRVTQRDTVSAISVIVLTALALLGGYLLRDWSESRTRSYEAPGGVIASFPSTWQLDTSEVGNGIVRARNSAATEAPTTFEMRWVAVDPQAEDDVALMTVANNLALNRGSELVSFKVFDLATGQTIRGMPGATSSYVFVDVPTQVFREHLPTVMVGEDYLVREGDRVYIFSVHSSEEDRDRAMQLFEEFVTSTVIPDAPVAGQRR